MKKRSILRRIGAFGLALTMVILAACTAVQIQSELTLNEDGSGSRTIRGLVAKNDHQDGYGSAYYYLRIHGDDLETYIVDLYTEAVAGSDEWLTVAVDDSGDEWEEISLSFDFESFDDYVAKLESLAYREDQAAAFLPPTLTENDDDTVTYTEPSATVTTIFKSLQTDIMEDEAVFDIDSTRDGEALNDGSADFDSLLESGVEFMKVENGDALTITLGTGTPAAVALDGDSFVFTGTYDGGAVPVDPNREPEVVFSYAFNDDLTSSGRENGDLTIGSGSSMSEAQFIDGVDGQAILLDGTTYLASPNETYSYSELTLSFYFRMDAYTETDTGANMVIVPAGLGALGAGVIDLEFLQTDEADGISFLAKMNSNDWMTQDNLFVEGYYLGNHLEEWHHYTVVYENEYDEFGNVNDAFVYIYVDGRLAAQSRLTVAAGLPFGLGLFDDGSFGDPNGGFNIGGYFEADLVKRGLTGALDNLVIYDGALSEEEINDLLYTVEVDNPYDPDVVETPGGEEPTETTEETTEETTGEESTEATVTETEASETDPTEEPDSDGINPGLVIGIVAGVLILAGIVGIVVSRRRKS